MKEPCFLMCRPFRNTPLPIMTLLCLHRTATWQCSSVLRERQQGLTDTLAKSVLTAREPTLDEIVANPTSAKVTGPIATKTTDAFFSF